MCIERERDTDRERESARERAYILASKSSKSSSNLAVKLVKMTNIVVNQTKVIKVGNQREEAYIYVYRETAYIYIYIYTERDSL